MPPWNLSIQQYLGVHMDRTDVLEIMHFDRNCLSICRYAYMWKENALRLPTLTAVSIQAARHKGEQSEPATHFQSLLCVPISSDSTTP